MTCEHGNSNIRACLYLNDCHVFNIIDISITDVLKKVYSICGSQRKLQ
jgi:hypothetical protein